MYRARNVWPWPRNPLLARVLHAAEAIEVGDAFRGRALAESVLEDAPATGSAKERVARVFALSLLARLAGDLSGRGNLYIHAPGPGDMLAAFDTLVERTPFIRFGYACANAAIAESVEGAERVHVIDVGLGSGTQWHDLLETLARRAGGPPAVHLTGVDLPAASAEPAVRLHAAGRALADRAEALGVPFEFDAIPAHAEDLDLEALCSEEADSNVVNAAFALHHVPADDGVTEPGRDRDSVLRRIRDCDPDVFTLVEPHVQHNTLPFLSRTREALAHYTLVFEALGALVPDEPEARRTLEHAFFGREILNVVVGEGPDRIERHEPFPAWIARLQANGFKQVDMSHHARYVRSEIEPGPPCGIEARWGGLLLTWDGTPLVAASAWRGERT